MCQWKTLLDLKNKHKFSESKRIERVAGGAEETKSKCRHKHTPKTSQSLRQAYHCTHSVATFTRQFISFDEPYDSKVTTGKKVCD